MTRGSRALIGNESLYDARPFVLLDRFMWSGREAVLTDLREILNAGRPEWTFGGAYLFWAQRIGAEGVAEILYVGEAESLAVRQSAHLLGPADGGNRFGQLDDYFSANPEFACGLAVLVVRPTLLPRMDPPDHPSFIDDDAAKRAGEALEGLLLRAFHNVFSTKPRWNERNDAARFRHDDDTVRFLSLIEYLCERPDASMDFTTFHIRNEKKEAIERLGAEVTALKNLLADDG